MFDARIEDALRQIRHSSEFHGVVDVGPAFKLVIELLALVAKEMDRAEEEVESTFLGFLAYHLICKNEEDKISEVLKRMKQWTEWRTPSVPYN